MSRVAARYFFDAFTQSSSAFFPVLTELLLGGYLRPVAAQFPPRTELSGASMRTCMNYWLTCRT